jgi:dihydrofolate reductase
VFVLTHHGNDPIQMGGGTTFHFITGGFDEAYSAACQAAGDNGVGIAGGASTVRQALIAGVIDELTLDIAPVLLGSGERIFDGAWVNYRERDRRGPRLGRVGDWGWGAGRW